MKQLLGITFISLCIALGLYVTVNANQEVTYKHDLYRQAKKLEAERDYYATREIESKDLKEVKSKEAIKKWGEYINVAEGPINVANPATLYKTQNEERSSINSYETEWEEYLFTKVEKTVDLPGFEDYQDLLASYAYNTCKIVMANEAQTKNGWKYDCQTMILVMNSENGGRNKDVMGAMNGNGTRDGGLFQLNTNYHNPFINSEWFENGLAQIEYGIGVWKDASRKGVMPRYGYHPRFARDKGIKFLK